MLKNFIQRETTQEQFPDLSGLLEKQYNHQVAQNHIQHDQAQFIAIQYLQTLLDNILATVIYDQKSVIRKLISPLPEKCQSLYIYGDVGRGKSMTVQ
jgi:cell division protein ZapE